MFNHYLLNEYSIKIELSSFFVQHTWSHTSISELSSLEMLSKLFVMAEIEKKRPIIMICKWWYGVGSQGNGTLWPWERQKPPTTQPFGIAAKNPAGGGGHTWRQLERALNRCPRITHSFIIIHLQCIQCGFDCPPPCRGWLPWPFPQGPYRAKISPSPSVQSPLDDWRQPQSQTALAWTPNPCPAATSGSAGSPTLRVYFGSEDY